MRASAIARAAALPVVVAGLLLAACGQGGESSVDAAARGDRLFHGEATCATCHGADLRGTPMGPAFLDPLYAPGRLPDEAIHDAVRNGVQPRNWQFGPMPPLTHLDEDDIDALVAYIRREQRAHGIT